MSSKDTCLYLQDILDSIEKIQQYVAELTLSAFDDSPALQDAVARRLEIIGEVAKRLPVDFKEKYPQIPWRQISGMRDILIHEYAGVSIERIWKTVRDDLGPLLVVIREALEKQTAEEKNHSSNDGD